MSDTQEDNGESETFLKKSIHQDEPVADATKSEDRVMGFNKDAVMAIILYWITSLSLVFLNKIIMDGDKTHIDAPLFMSWTQFVVTVICCAALGQIGKYVPLLAWFPPFEYDLNTARNVLPLTGVFLGMIIFNNLCLKYVQVSFYQVARSLTIFFNVIFSYLILGTTTKTDRLLCCVGICVGYYLGCDGESEFSWTGVVFGGLSSIFVALNSIFVSKVKPFVNNSSGKLMVYNNLNAALTLPPIIYFFTDEPFVLSMNLWAFGNPVVWVYIAVGGIAGCLIAFATISQIKYTSPLSHNVSGTAKAAAQTVIAVFVLGDTVTAQSALGIGVVLLFSFAYAKLKK